MLAWRVMTTTPRELSLPVGSLGTITARHFTARSATAPILVLAHGAGADQRHRFMVTVASSLAAAGVHVVTFNFLYTEQRRRSPDRAPVLEQTWAAVLEGLSRELPLKPAIVVGGKSMGGRIASLVLASPPATAAWSRVKGLVLLGYPLHPPGKPDAPRTSHLPAIRVPILLVQGTRDSFGTRDEVTTVFDGIPAKVTYDFIEGGDHSFAVPKSPGLTERDVLDGVTSRVARWVLDL
jgi:predicted alpha/beta-hydrolase family hydrolase